MVSAYVHENRAVRRGGQHFKGMENTASPEADAMDCLAWGECYLRAGRTCPQSTRSQMLRDRRLIEALNDFVQETGDDEALRDWDWKCRGVRR